MGGENGNGVPIEKLQFSLANVISIVAVIIVAAGVLYRFESKMGALEKDMSTMRGQLNLLIQVAGIESPYGPPAPRAARRGVTTGSSTNSDDEATN